MGDITGSLRFGEFVLDFDNRQLLRGGESVELGSRYFDALALLATNPRSLVTKERFMNDVWKGIPVTDEALTQCIRTLRRSLGDEASAPRFIETVPKHGYRFVAEVAEAQDVPLMAKQQPPAARLAGATTLGAFAAGLSGGIFYGIAGTTGGAAGIATLILLSATLAVLGGAAIGAGMALATLWRGERDWAVVLGGAAGGIVIGGLGSALAAYGMQSLTGVFPDRVTGMFEGMALGSAAGASFQIVLRANMSRTAATILATLVGASVTGLTALAGGSFLGGTLALLEAQFPASHLRMAGVGALFGDEGFREVTRLVTAMLEGAAFTSAIVYANLAWRIRRK